jgi:hypothetical protein
MRRTFTLSCSLFFLLVLASGCQMTQSGFARTANNAGSAFAAASITLSYAHEGMITKAYAQSSFMNYQSELSGLDQQVPSQQGTPDKQQIEHLLDLYKPAMQVVNSPCLASTCHWQAQVAALDRASKAFLEAGQ